MKTPHCKLLLILLLPLMLGRALLPSGYMVSFEQGKARLAFCPAQGDMPRDDAPPAHHHHHAMGHHHNSTGAHDGGACPFAMAAGAALQPTIALIATTSHVEHFSNSIDATAISSDTYSAAHPIRGPPIYS